MKKVLLIEDDKSIAAALGVRLRSHGYEVLAAFDAVGGLAAAKKALPDLVLLDISMPGGGGLLVAERLRNLPATSCTPIIFITASKDPQYRERAAQLGASGFFEKPFESQDLLAAIAKTLGQSAESAPAAEPSARNPLGESVRAG